MEEFDWSEVENADYMLDIETSNRKRKRVRGNDSEACYIPKSDRYDEDYVSFFEGLEEFRESKFKVNEEERDNEEEEDDDDPLYLAFLENLEEHGNAYKCRVSVEYGVFSPIVYEEESDFTPLKRKTPKSNEGTYSKVKNRVDVNARIHHSDVVKGKTTPISHGSGLISSEKTKVGENLRTSRENLTPQCDFSDEYKKSSEVAAGVKPRKHRNRYINVGMGKTKFPSRRGGSNGGVDEKGDRKSSSMYSSLGEQVSLEVEDTYKNFLDNLYVEGGSLIFKYGDNKQIMYECSDQQSSDDEIEPSKTDVKSRASRESTRKEGSRKPRQSNSPKRPMPSTLKLSTSIPRPATPPSREKASTTKSHLLSSSACKTKKKYCEHSLIRKELHDYLKKPYVQKEFDDLMRKLSDQKPVEIYRESRSGGSVRYGGIGKSYLQHYPDVMEEIRKVESNRKKVLNLLRMLTFYLTKIPSGFPQPWKEDYFKSIMPGQKLHGSN